MSPSSEFHVVGGFSLDAVLHADGTFETDRLGGNALWAATGALAYGVTPFAHATVGHDYPEQALEKVRDMGVDTRYVTRNSLESGVRVTFEYAMDGSRQQPASQRGILRVPEPHRSRFIDTTRSPEVILASLPTAEDLPSNRSEPRDWHLGLLPAVRFRELVEHLAEGGDYIQADCPARFELRRDGVHVLGETLSMVDLFLPSTSDTEVFLPGTTPLEQISLFHDLGATAVVLKCGEGGALVSLAGEPLWHVPIFPEPRAIDATGAGDVFAGGLAAALNADGDVVNAVCAGAAVASLGITVRSPLEFPSATGRELDRRYRTIKKGVVQA